MSFLVKGRFQALPQWLDKLTAHDLSGVDASGCQPIDEWFHLLEGWAVRRRPGRPVLCGWVPLSRRAA